MSNNRVTYPHLLVVGGNGFIGRHIINHALELGWFVTSLSLSLPINKEESKKLRFISADICNKASLYQALKETSFEYVVNCGGYINHELYFDGGRKVLDTHFSGVLNLVEVLDRKTLKAFVNIGSSDEYGTLSAPQNELMREEPISPYSMGKLASTHFLQMLWRTEHFPATTLRLFLTYGPGQDNQRFLPQVIKGCLEDKSFPTSGGEQLRDFCYVQDSVNAIFTTIESINARGQVINISSGQPISIYDMINTIRDLIGKGTPNYGKIAYRQGENMSLYADVSLAKSLLGWESTTSLEAGLKNTIDWVKAQE